MDLTTGIVNFKQAELGSRIQYAVARKMLDNQEAQGAAAIKLLESAMQTGAKAGDSLVAAATGLGAQVDAYA
jgi:hypothetical protein